ncbi:hypothetical protein Q3F77_01850 [Enterococcus faecium]|uniref:hypothetical protein n=1 Tax=Enterococcus faecium TaxID=1352 RepID=UPI0019E9756E|nr:hypothetical protein [Enterococcus faecium]EGP5185372.1 hypothetical protein [Enterococcus faecium]MBX4202413.1 hypothetical protein [Enterococcus faecium]MDQ8564565.1 hypothetical protein [Enterococcus faecium]WGG87697.1 hypothetical protein P8R96_02630 [Enterococcus faecium]
MEWFCKFLLFLEVIHVYGFVFLTNKKAGSTMDHLYIKYIHQFSVLVLGTLVIAGIVAFIIQGRDILTVHQEFFSYACGIPLIAIRSDNKKWKKRYYIFLLFLCFYLPPKIFTVLGIQCLSFSFISYIIVLIFLSFIVWVFYLVKK